MSTRLFLAAYRVRPGQEADVLPHLREEMATLRARGHVTKRRGTVTAQPAASSSVQVRVGIAGS
jgi:hypothetical protein